MTVDLLNAPPYLRTPAPKLWKLSSDGEVLAWTHGMATIVFAKQLALILQHYCAVHKDLPPLTAVLFVLDAISDRKARLPREARIAEYEQRIEQLALLSALKPPDHARTAAATWLAHLTDISRELRQGPRAQGELLGVVFSGVCSASVDADLNAAFDVIQWLHVPPQDRLLQKDFAVDQFRCRDALSQLIQIANLNRDADSIALQIKTGLTAVPEPQKESESEETEQSYAELLEELTDDEQVGKIAQLSLAVASSLTLPRRPSDPDDLPAGGVSDITNRGLPDRLLLSELAAEPMLLLARIATGQALYMRRERPPLANKGVRHIFVENSIRSWGQNRVYQAVTALALAASEERTDGAEPVFWTLGDGDLIPEDFKSRDGIVKHLSRLSATPHPGTSLAEIESAEMLVDVSTEPLFVLTEQSTQDPEFRRLLAKLPKPLFVVRVGRSGTVALLRHSDLGEEQLHQQTIDASQLTPKHLPKPKHNLPLFCTLVRPLPLRVTADAHGAVWRAACPGPELWMVDRRQRLLCFDKPNHAALEIHEDLKVKEVLGYCFEDQRLQLAYCEAGTKDLILLSADKTGNVESRRLDVAKGKVAFDRGLLLHIQSKVIDFYDMNDGGRVSVLKTYDSSVDLRSTHLGGALFRSLNDRIWLASYDAPDSRWYDRGRYHGARASAAVEIGEGQFVTISHDLRTLNYFAAGQSATERPIRGTVAGLSHASLLEQQNDGNRILLRAKSANTHVVRLVHLDLDDGTATSTREYSWPNFGATVNPTSISLSSSRSVRSKLQQIAVTRQHIFLLKNPQKPVRICAEPGRIWLQHNPLPPEAIRTSFKDCDDGKVSQQRWKLKRADFSGGIAWLDRRGFLHLRRRSDQSEMTLVLDDQSVAGWISENNSTFGNAYHLRDSAQALQTHIIFWLQKFAEECFQSN